MKILHAAFMITPLPGIKNQMDWERLAAKELGLDWDVRLFCCHPEAPDSELIVQAKIGSTPASGKGTSFVDRARLHLNYLHWLRSVERHYDAILLRYNACDPFQAGFVRSIKRPVFSVHHTLEIPELKNLYQGCNRAVHVGLEKLTEKFTLNATHGTIAVTEEILQYEGNRNPRVEQKPGHIYPNGIYYEPGNTGTPQDTRHAIPEFLFVASYFAPWHGLDRLLASLSNSDDAFILHLVGGINDKDKAAATADPRIRIHGQLDSTAIQTLSRQCWLGLSSFALDRKQMHQACTLKVREYLLNGLPVYAGYRDVFPEGFQYYRMGSPDIRDILRYGRSTRNASRAEVAAAARPFISKSALLRGLHDWLESRVQA